MSAKDFIGLIRKHESILGIRGNSNNLRFLTLKWDSALFLLYCALNDLSVSQSIDAASVNKSFPDAAAV